MSRIAKRFAQLKADKRAGLVTYVTAGDPNGAVSYEILKGLPAAGADLIDLNMGCPVPKVMKTGAGAALLKDPDTAVAVARAAREGSGLPVTVKLRAEGVGVARRLVEEAGVAGITFHPRTVKVRHKGRPDYDLAAELVAELPVPVIVSGGMDDGQLTVR